MKGGGIVKILFLAAANSIHTVRWVNSLANKGLEVHLAYIKGHDPSVNELNEKVILHSLKYSGNLGYYLNMFELKKIYKKINPDVVNVHYASGYGTLARFSNIRPCLLSVWGSDVYDFPYDNKIKMKIINKNLKFADSLSSTSHCMAEQTKKVLSDSTKEINVIPFGVDLEEFNPAKYIKNNTDKIIIGNIKTLESKYGISDLIKATKLLLNQLNKEGKEKLSEKIEVHIYGEGSQKEELNSLIEDLNLEKKVYLKGRIKHKEVPNILSQFTIFCCTSILDSESFGVSVVEAMAMNVPVIATDVDGFKEVIKKDCGIIIKRKDSKMLYKAIYSLLVNPLLYETYKTNGRKNVINNFSWSNNVELIINAYEKMQK